MDGIWNCSHCGDKLERVGWERGLKFCMKRDCQNARRREWRHRLAAQQKKSKVRKRKA